MCAGYVKRAMKEGIHKKLDPKQLIFLLLVLTHSEDVEDQRLCYKEYLRLEKTLDPEDPLLCFNDIFKKHLDVVEKFGRFPHRNTIHERENTPEEDEFLLDGAFRFDLPVRKNASGDITFAREGKQLWKLLKDKSKSTQPTFLDIAKEARRRSSYLSLYGEGEDETDNFYYDENGKELSKLFICSIGIKLLMTCLICAYKNFSSNPAFSVLVMLLQTSLLNLQKDILSCTKMLLEEIVGVCCYSILQTFPQFVLLSWVQLQSFTVSLLQKISSWLLCLSTA